MRLIDADILKSAIDVDGYEHFSGCLSSSEVSLLEMVKDDIDETPTVDAVPVVRCRECKKKNKKKCPMTIVNFGRDGKEILVQNHVPDDFYCAAGERKEGADNG